jgi:hypothetical protein
MQKTGSYGWLLYSQPLPASDVVRYASKPPDSSMTKRNPVLGPIIYENWKAFLAGAGSDTGFEYDLYSDVMALPAVREELGPYQLLWAGREVPSLIHSPAAVLRLDLYRADNVKILSQGVVKRDSPAGYHGGDLQDEFAAIASLVVGVRLAASENYSRRFGFDADPRGQPINSHEPRIVPKPIMSGVVLNSVLTVREDCDMSLLGKIPLLNATDAQILTTAARLYQEAIWYSEHDANYSWLMLVSSVETVAQHWKRESASPVERMRDARPELYNLLLAQGDDDFVAAVADQMADYMGATRKFTDFLLRFEPGPPDKRPDPRYQIDWTEDSLLKAFKTVYRLRSSALHGGVRFPYPMCTSTGPTTERPTFISTTGSGYTWLADSVPMLLQTFEHIVRGSILNWWRSLVPEEIKA